MTLVKLDEDIKEGDGLLGDFISEFNGGSEIVGKINKIEKVRFGKRRNDETIVNVAPEIFRGGAGIGGHNLVFYITHEETCITRAHFRAHGNSAYLLVKSFVELKRI